MNKISSTFTFRELKLGQRFLSVKMLLAQLNLSLGQTPIPVLVKDVEMPNTGNSFEHFSKKRHTVLDGDAVLSLEV